MTHTHTYAHIAMYGGMSRQLQHPRDFLNVALCVFTDFRLVVASARTAMNRNSTERIQNVKPDIHSTDKSILSLDQMKRKMLRMLLPLYCLEMTRS